MQKGNVLIFLLVGVLVIAAVGGAFYLGKQTTPKPSPVPVVTPQTPQLTPAPSTPASSDETINWKTYTNTKMGIEIKYPEVYKLEKESVDEVSFSGLYSGNQRVPNVLVITTKITNLDSQPCQDGDDISPCISNKSTLMKLDNKDAVSFDLQYQGGGFGFSNRIQTIQDPKIEIYQTVYGGGGTRGFNQILSTFKFL